MKTFVLGDPHGGLKSIRQVFKKSKIDPAKDKLICLGDIADGWPQTPEALEEIIKIKNLIFLMGNHDCVDKETECLTKTGWKKYNKILKNDLIFSINPEKNKGEWNEINKIIIKKTKKLNHIKNQHVDLMCTDTHRILTEKRYQKNKKTRWAKLSYTTANKITGRHRFPVCAVCDRDDYKELTDSEIKIMAWILTDGGLQRKKESHIGQYSIYQSKYVEHIKRILDEADYAYKLSSRIRDITSICGRKLKKKPMEAFCFSFPKESGLKIKKYLPQKYPFPEKLYNLSKRQFDIFLEEVILADGSVYKGEGRTKCSIIFGPKIFLNHLQALCVVNGKRAVLAKDNRGSYRLNVSEYSFSMIEINKKKKKIVSKEQIVWCLSVPLGNFMVRRNGKAFFTGNSWLLEWLKTGEAQPLWTRQGGQATIDAYEKQPKLKKKHLKFLEKALYYYIDDKNRCFVHGGIKPGEHPSKTSKNYLVWDRDIWHKRYDGLGAKKFDNFNEVYVGHTSIYEYSKTPLPFGNVWFIDTGGGWEGKLSMIDIESKEIFQSEKVSKLYKEELAKKEEEEIIKLLKNTI